MSNNGIDPKMIEEFKKALSNGDVLQNMSKIAEMMTEPKKSDAVKKLLTNKALEKMQEKNRLESEVSNLDPRLNLLVALKPFLTERRARKVDRMVKAMSLGYLFRDLNKLI